MRSGQNRLTPRNKKEFPEIAFNFWIISAYFRRSWFCSRRLSGFAREAKIQSDFVPLTDLITCKRRGKDESLTINTHSWLEEEPLKIRGDCQGDFIF